MSELYVFTMPKAQNLYVCLSRPVSMLMGGAWNLWYESNGIQHFLRISCGHFWDAWVWYTLV